MARLTLAQDTTRSNLCAVGQVRKRAALIKMGVASAGWSMAQPEPVCPSPRPGSTVWFVRPLRPIDES
jgi:hypothetical protein